MKALITGCSGFIGSHLAELLIKKNLEVYGTTYRGDTTNIVNIKDEIKLFKIDITRKEDVQKLIHEIEPDYVFHLAAQSLVTVSWNDPERTLKTNMLGTLFLLDAIRKESIDPIIEVACSSAEYGKINNNRLPMTEDENFKPTSVYAISKIACDILSELYSKVYKMKIIRARLFSISGPRKVSDFISDFAKGIVEVEKNITDQLSVGELSYVRDVTDVRDAVKALWILAQKGKTGDVYNICSGKGYKIKDVLNILLSISNKKIKVREKAPEKLRLIDDDIFVGDNSRIKELGWEPKIRMEQTLRDTLEYWRHKI